VSRFNGGLGLFKLYGVSLACFVLVGAIVLNLYVILYANAGDTWSTGEQTPWPTRIVTVVFAVLMNGPVIWARALPLAAIAASLYCALALTFSPRILRAGVGALRGALAAVITRPWQSAPKSGSAMLDPTRGAHSRVTVVLAWGVVLAAIAAAFNDGRARTDEVLLRPDGAIAANALRALPVAERAGVVAGLLASANHQATWSSRCAT